ncbi:ABC transporter (glutamine transport ATP-binding protein) [Imhoffiella purpurea]|uniref:ABC transporter (Glutamine transport ATP-binding protein) n=2 Tax=Imhoffiella purpurea TaxID=1249627 RepID=W9VKG3_9GAMM|nr:ABC transporter (glutamine transport ATP-binding protein) [Imhoffiella purpurea]
MIRADGLVKHFDGGLIKALDGVGLEVRLGEVCAITGPSGCGKSTLLNLIGALASPTRGEIRIDGRPLAELGPACLYRRRYLGFVFQLHHLIPDLTLCENVEIPLMTTALGRRKRRERAMALLAEMGLEHRAGSMPSRVSGGERQRAAVARALAMEPPIVLADEPTGSLDSRNAGLILDALLARCRQLNTTLVIVTHDPGVAARADRVVEMLDGRIL